MKYKEGTTFEVGEEYDKIVGFDSGDPEDGNPHPSYIIETVNEDGVVIMDDYDVATERYHGWIEDGTAVQVPEEETPF